jgi:hypothetical protein
MKMFWLVVKFNEIATVDEDALWDSPELKFCIVINNKLSKLHNQTFHRYLHLNEGSAATSWNFWTVMCSGLFLC